MRKLCVSVFTSERKHGLSGNLRTKDEERQGSDQRYCREKDFTHNERQGRQKVCACLYQNVKTKTTWQPETQTTKKKKKKKGVGTGEEKVTRRLIQSKPPGIIIVIIIINATKTDIDYGGLQINSPSRTIP